MTKHPFRETKQFNQAKTIVHFESWRVCVASKQLTLKAHFFFFPNRRESKKKINQIGTANRNVLHCLIISRTRSACTAFEKRFTEVMQKIYCQSWNKKRVGIKVSVLHSCCCLCIRTRDNLPFHYVCYAV